MLLVEFSSFSKTLEILVESRLLSREISRNPFVCNVSIEINRRTRPVRQTPLPIGPKSMFSRNVALAQGESNVFEASIGACHKRDDLSHFSPSEEEFSSDVWGEAI